MNWNNSPYNIKIVNDFNVTSMIIVNDISVTVPASLKFMTPYVLREQNDWFEDEIKFLRTFIKPGMRVIDIGANYGLYTLTFAKIIGEQGRVWAFEPTATTSACLQQSISENNFNNIELIQAGLSDRIGQAIFFTDPNSELNSLSKESVSGNSHETISLLTLDHCAKKYNWGDIDFIKLDAEGEESNIVEKGEEFLSSASPLIMFELMHGEKVNAHLINHFTNLGYESYRLIPGLNVLVPFKPNKPFDDFLLNIFCCKEDKAALLESEDIIVKHWEEMVCSHSVKIVEDHLIKFPFGKSLNKLTFGNNKTSKDYLDVLAAYILAQSESTCAVEKVGYLMTALNGLRNMLEKGEQSIERSATFARIAFDAGERFLGAKILLGLIKRHDNNLDFEITEPFLPVSLKYDTIDPNNNMKEWLFSSVLEQFITKHVFSSYYEGSKSLPLLDMLGRLGFMDEEMQRRENMIKSCFSS
jgi:FkbM family methyltransferase